MADHLSGGVAARQRTDTEVAHDLARALAREERRRKRLARALTGVGAVVLLLVVLAGAGVAMRASASSAAPVSAPPPTDLSTPARQPSEVPAAGASTPAAEPDASTAAAAPKKNAAPPKKTGSKRAAAPKPAPTSKRIAIPPPQAVSQQHFKIAIGSNGYEPASITAMAGGPITLTVGKGEGCAAGFKIPRLGVRADNSSGPVTIKLGRLKRGSYTYTCSMGMVSGTLRVR